MSVDSYMNIQLANTEEYIDGKNTGTLGQVLIRCVCLSSPRAGRWIRRAWVLMLMSF